MSQDQIQLPEPDLWAVYWGHELRSLHSVYLAKATAEAASSELTHFQTGLGPIYSGDTVRRLIASAVATERAKNIAALEALNLWDYDDPASSAIAGIQGDQT